MSRTKSHGRAYSGEGRPESYAELAREVVSRNPDVIVPISASIMEAVSAATRAIPIVGSGAYTETIKKEGTLPSFRLKTARSTISRLKGKPGNGSI
jgi:ABC-type uncharacterized transport system substrate-binding protein